MNHVFSRRHALLGGISFGCCVACTAPWSKAAAGSSTGCWIPKDETDDYLNKSQNAMLFETGQEQLEPRSGDSSLDRALARALSKIARTFGVLPAFAFYDDAGSPNAKATPVARDDRADGTVMFGLNLLQRLLATSRPDVAIIAVCSHEFGHIASYKNGMINALAPTRDPFHAEQFADYMAGYYAGSRRLESADFPAVIVATTQRTFGGGDHGSGKQRGDAVQAGFLAAYQRKLDAEAAKKDGLDFALSKINED